MQDAAARAGWAGGLARSGVAFRRTAPRGQQPSPVLRRAYARAMVGRCCGSQACALPQWTRAGAGERAVADPDQPRRCACLQPGSAAGLVVAHALPGRGVAARTITRTRSGRQCRCAHAGSAVVPDAGSLRRLRPHACAADRWQRRCAGTRECVDRVRGAPASARGADAPCGCGRYRADAAGGRSCFGSCTCLRNAVPASNQHPSEG